MSLVLRVKEGDAITVNETLKIMVKESRRGTAVLIVDGPREMQVDRVRRSKKDTENGTQPTGTLAIGAIKFGSGNGE